MAEIRVDNLVKQFGGFTAVRNANFTVENGDFFCLLGPSGCGKTTTLRMIAGLELPTSGRILLDGEDVTFRRARERDIAMVFQLFALYPHMNVRRNISFPLVSMGVPREETRKRVEDAARILRIEHLLNKSVSGLSGGDRQRVALGRAIVREPKAFMMDEPLGALDAEFRHLMCGELRALHDRLKATTVYVTHDQLEAMSMADKIAVMNEGEIEQLGAPQDIYDFPASMFVGDFIGSPAMNFIHFESGLATGDTSVTIDGATIAVPALRETRNPGPLALGVRPEQIIISDRLGAPDAIPGEVFGAEYLGTNQIITLITPRGSIKARAPAHARAIAGDRVSVAFRAERLSLFDAATGKAIDSARDAHATGTRHG
ncbi:ABC transporter ATP-binding protein [Terrarubrum flagellatum]|uniref:ABC transporter ATP-binding protein n=1 Tax=Terrirubrum flagellatum TaxID=2895980 RepID=UPI003144F2DF